jgi:hypothetical protein
VIDVRLINADALIDDLKHDVAADQDSLDYEELTDSNREMIQFDKDCKQNAIDLLQNAPTIEPERKTGKWIEYNATGKKQWMCSECCVEEKNPKVARFCYWCGADMRGEQE